MLYYLIFLPTQYPIYTMYPTNIVDFYKTTYIYLISKRNLRDTCSQQTVAT